jgi:hypothetical protein
LQLVDVEERMEMGRAVPCDRQRPSWPGSGVSGKCPGPSSMRRLWPSTTIRLRFIRGTSRATASPSAGIGLAAAGTGVVVGQARPGSSTWGQWWADWWCPAWWSSGRRRTGELFFEVARQRALCLGRLDPGTPQLIGDEGEHHQTERDQGAPDAVDDPTPVVWRLGTVPVADLLVADGGLFGHGVRSSRDSVIRATSWSSPDLTPVEPTVDAIGTIVARLDRAPARCAGR